MTYRVGTKNPLNIYRITKDHPEGISVGYCRTDHEATQLVEAANVGETVRAALAHHLDAGTDPCQDRGVEWPCDVADALGAAEDGGA